MHTKMNRRRFAGVVCTLLTPGITAAQSEQGYRKIQPARPLEESTKLVEVVDVFWYGCPHCYQFLPYIESWRRDAPDDVSMKRLPAIFRDSWEPHARAYFTAVQLGFIEELHVPVFKAIHGERRSLNTQAELRRFFVEFGVDADQFDESYSSFSVEAKVQTSHQMPRRWGVQGTPSVIVNGRYLLSGSTAGNYETLVAIGRQLVEQERARLQSA